MKNQCKCTMKKVHLHAPTETALRMLRENYNLLNCSPEQAEKELLGQQALGKQYFSGCGNETSDGRCAGCIRHENDCIYS